jgi:hypothetical protein
MAVQAASGTCLVVRIVQALGALLGQPDDGRPIAIIVSICELDVDAGLQRRLVVPRVGHVVVHDKRKAGSEQNSYFGRLEEAREVLVRGRGTTRNPAAQPHRHCGRRVQRLREALGTSSRPGAACELGHSVMQCFALFMLVWYCASVACAERESSTRRARRCRLPTSLIPARIPDAFQRNAMPSLPTYLHQLKAFRQSCLKRVCGRHFRPLHALSQYTIYSERRRSSSFSGGPLRRKICNASAQANLSLFGRWDFSQPSQPSIEGRESRVPILSCNPYTLLLTSAPIQGAAFRTRKGGARRLTGSSPCTWCDRLRSGAGIVCSSPLLPGRDRCSGSCSSCESEALARSWLRPAAASRRTRPGV